MRWSEAEDKIKQNVRNMKIGPVSQCQCCGAVLCDLGRAGMEPASGQALIKYRDRGFIKIFAIQARGVNYRMSAARSVRWSEERPGENTNIWRPGGRWMSVWGGGGAGAGAAASGPAMKNSQAAIGGL